MVDESSRTAVKKYPDDDEKESAVAKNLSAMIVYWFTSMFRLILLHFTYNPYGTSMIRMLSCSVYFRPVTLACLGRLYSVLYSVLFQTSMSRLAACKTPPCSTFLFT